MLDRLADAAGRLVAAVGLMLLGAAAGIMLVGALGIPSFLHNETLIGAGVGALGAIVGGWVGAALVGRREDARQARIEGQEKRRVQAQVVAALRAVLDEATGNTLDIQLFLRGGEAATTKLSDDNYRLYHGLLAEHLPADVYYIFAASYRQLAFARRLFASGKTPNEMSADERGELGYVRAAMQRIGALAYAVQEKDYAQIKPAGDPRETIKRYFDETGQDAPEQADADGGGPAITPDQAPGGGS